MQLNDGSRMSKFTFEPNSVALQAVHRLFEEGLTRGGHSRDVILIPFNGGVDILEYLLDRVCNFSTNTVSRNEGNLQAA